MRTKSVVYGILASLAPSAAFAGFIDIQQSLKKAGVQSDIGYPTIVVDGAGTNRYDTIHNKTVDVWVTVSRSKKWSNEKGFAGGSIKIDGGGMPLQNPEPAKILKVTIPYIDLRSYSVANQRVSPIKYCNDRLDEKSGASKQKFLDDGGEYNRPRAYKAEVSAAWYKRTGINEAFYYADAETDIGVRIVCRPLNGPKVRTTTTTTGSSGAPRANAPPPPTRTNPPPVRTNPPPVRTNPDPVRVNPEIVDEPAAEFDVLIRRVDNEGPDGAVQLWVYNAGPDDAVGCSLGWRGNANDVFVRISNLPAIGPRETHKVEGTLPSNSGGEFRVDCATEPESAFENNTAVLE